MYLQGYLETTSHSVPHNVGKALPASGPRQPRLWCHADTGSNLGDFARRLHPECRGWPVAISRPMIRRVPRVRAGGGEPERDPRQLNRADRALPTTAPVTADRWEAATPPPAHAPVDLVSQRRRRPHTDDGWVASAPGPERRSRSSTLFVSPSLPRLAVVLRIWAVFGECEACNLLIIKDRVSPETNVVP